MRTLKSSLLILAVALATFPAAAAIKAMNLAELMTVTTDAAHVRILEKSTFHLAYPFPEAVYTKLHVKGVSLRTEKPVDTDLVFLGSQDPADHYGISEMPTLQDTRVGSDVIVFFQHDTDFPGTANVVHDLGEVYRVEKAFGAPVVIGKGDGFAFAENTKLDVAEAKIRQTHLALATSNPKSGNGK